MAIIITATDLKQDGSIAITLPDGKVVNFVKESDLGAVKSASEGKDGEITHLKAEILSLTAKVGETHQNLLQERTAKEQLEAKVSKQATLEKEVGELRTKTADLEKVSGKVSIDLADRVRKNLVTTYKVKEDILKDKALGELQQMEQTLTLVGIVPGSGQANFDRSFGLGGTGSLTKTADDLIREGLAAAKK